MINYKKKILNKLINKISSFEVLLPLKERDKFRGVIQRISISNKKLEMSHKQIENKLYVRNEQYDSLINNIDLGISIINSEYRILMVNAAHGRFYNRDEKDFINKECFRELAKRDSICSTCPGTIAMATGMPSVVEDVGTREDGSSFTVRIKACPIFDEDGKARKFIEVVEDITDRKRSEQEIEKLAYFDTLTDLPNRLLVKDRLNQHLVYAKRYNEQVGVIFIDLDHFKRINDTKGHTSGDELLKAVAKRLVKTVRENDTVARLGGDEFVIVCPGIRHEQDIAYIAQKILNTFSMSFKVEGKKTFITASMGIAFFPLDGLSVGKLLRNADTAMYAAKEQGRNNYQFFSQEMNQKAVALMELENNMRQALERKEFYLLYQPQINLESGEVVGVEALLRWNHPQMGLVLPDIFIPVAEDTGIIIQIGEWVLRTACQQLKSWHEMGFSSLRVAVNISGQQFKQKNFTNMVEDILMEVHLKPNSLELEITESILIANVEHTTKILNKLKDTGVGLAIDDFGTGYCSLNYLQNFPINRIKIDKSFICEITRNQNNAAITEAIIALSNSLGLCVIAEGVEEIEQLNFLRERKCYEMQGYLFSKPIPVDELDKFLSINMMRLDALTSHTGVTQEN